jgi:putative transposase
VHTPNPVLAGDIAYISTTDGWLHLAVLLDLYSRRRGLGDVGLLDTELALFALRMAASTRPLAPDWIHHTDRDCRYGSDDDLEALAQLGARPSMNRKGDCRHQCGPCDVLAAQPRAADRALGQSDGKKPPRTR